MYELTSNLLKRSCAQKFNYKCMETQVTMNKKTGSMKHCFIFSTTPCANHGLYCRQVKFSGTVAHKRTGHAYEYKDGDVHILEAPYPLIRLYTKVH